MPSAIFFVLFNIYKVFCKGGVESIGHDAMLDCKRVPSTELVLDLDFASKINNL